MRVNPNLEVDVDRSENGSFDPDIGHLPPSLGPGPSPLWPQHLVDLFLRPRSFFSKNLALGNTPYVLFVTWCYGISNAVSRVETEIMRSEFGRARPGWEHFGPFVAESWLGFWIYALAIGAVSGYFLWWIGGWWYRVRLRWSGAPDPDKRLARLLLIYSSFVFSGPTVAAALIQTLAYPDFATAYAADEWYSAVLLIFPFWSVATSFIGVRTLFSVTKWKAIVWFAVLPVMVYLAAFGLFAALFALFGEVS
jgi:hypothetical protein